MVSKAVLSSEKDNWETPQAFFDRLNSEFDFKLDAAAEHGKNKCELYITPEMDALTTSWDTVIPADSGRVNVFLNPPYGRGKTVETWMRRAHEMSKLPVFKNVVCLVASRTDTVWFHEVAWRYAAEIRFVRGRLVFEEGGVPAKNSGTFPSVVVIFNNAVRNHLDDEGEELVYFISPTVAVMDSKASR